MCTLVRQSDSVDAGLGRAFLLSARHHVVETRVDEVFSESDAGGLIVEAGGAVGAADAGVWIRNHAARGIDQEQSFETLCAGADAV